MPTALIAKFLTELGATVLREGRAADEPFARIYAADAVWRAHQQRVEPCASVNLVDDVLLAKADICLLGGEDLPGLTRSTGAPELCEQFPRLIALEVTGYPYGSSHEGRPAVDILIQAVSGLAGEQFADRPIDVGFKPSLYGAALQGIAGVLAALTEREASGRGQAVFTSLFEGALCWCAGLWCDVERATAVTRLVVPKDVQPLIFRCNDGQYLHIAFYTPGSLEAAYRVLGIATQGSAGKKENAVPSSAPSKFFGDVDLIAPCVARRSSGELLQSLRAAGVACDLALPPGACWDHPQTEYNRVIARDNDNRAYVGNPIQLAIGRGPGHGRALATVDAPLGQVKVVDLGTFVAGPFGSVILGDLGADVIKVESMSGDTARTVFRCDASVNRGKRNIKLDLKSARGIEVLKRLCGRANLVMSNFRAGVSARLGIDPVSLQREFPDLAVIECPAYGNGGPRSAEAGFDMVMQAWCGHELRAGGTGNPPLWSRLTMVDYGGGMLGAVAALACLYQQARNGGGITATIPLLHAGLYLLSELVRNADGTFAGVPCLNSAQTGVHPAESFYEARGGWLAIAARDEASARRLVEALDIQDHVASRAAQWGSREQAAIAAALGSMSRARALDLLQRYDVWAEPWNRGQEQKWLQDPTLNEAGSVYRTEYPDIGVVGMIGTLVHFSRSTARGRGYAPTAGEHTRQILAELGYDESTIAGLYADNVVA